MTHTKEEIMLNNILQEIVQILAKKIKTNEIDPQSFKDLIEQRKIDVGNLPEVAEIEGNSYIHISNKTLSNRDNKISFPSFVNSITELPHVNVPNPVEDKHIANKEYVDVKDSSLQSQVSTKAEKTYVDSNLNLKANLASPKFTGTPTAPTPATSTNSTQIATTAFVKSQDYATNENLSWKADKTYVDSSLNLKANIASPNLTGVPTAPTASTTTNSSQIATTAFVKTVSTASITDLSITGMICEFATQNFNDFGNWIYCNGRSLSTSSYPELFNKIGYKFGGSGTLFNIPDLRGRVTSCAQNSSGVESINYKEGAKTHTLGIHEMPSHMHNTGIDMGCYGASDPNGPRDKVSGTSNLSSARGTSYTGGSGAHNNMQPTIYLAKFIYFK